MGWDDVYSYLLSLQGKGYYFGIIVFVILNGCDKAVDAQAVVSPAGHA
jgi:uncharacterized membrane protein YiaA